MKHREQSKEKEDAGLKKYLIKKKYQWIRLLLVVALLIAAMSFGIYTAGIQMPYALINIGLIGLIAAGLIYDFKFNTVLSVVMTVFMFLSSGGLFTFRSCEYGVADSDS